MKNFILVLATIFSFIACEKTEEKDLLKLDSRIQGEWVLVNQSGENLEPNQLDISKTLSFFEGNFVATTNNAESNLESYGRYSIFNAESFIYGKEAHVILFEPAGGIRTLIDINHDKLVLTEDIADGYIYIYERKNKKGIK